MNYNYQKSNRYFVQVADDLKTYAAEELTALGASDVLPAYRGLYLNADKETVYAMNFNSRLVNKILAPLISFDCHSDKYLYKTAYEIEWSDFLTPDMTFAVFASVSHSTIRHSKFAALRVKDAIADYFRNKSGKRPNVDTRNPDAWFSLHLENNFATISLDTSGGSLHRRGYRLHSVEAPMAETLAAAIIRLSEWQGNTPLVDPMCGSGTILCEGFMKQSGIPAGFLRNKFGFERLPDFDPELWKRVKSESFSNRRSVEKGLISGSDISDDAVRASKKNLENLQAGERVSIVTQDIFKLDGIRDATIICNPPYGIRMGKKNTMEYFYKSLGDFFKQKCKNSVAYVYFGERKYIKNIGLKAGWKKVLSNGPLDGRLVKFELY